MQQELPLSGKIVLVTGAARRIGRALALACARAGADVIIHYGRSKQEARTVQQEITAMHRRAWIIPADLEQSGQIAKLISQTDRIGRLYALVNSAAIFEPLSVRDTKLIDWERHMKINVTAPFLLSQAFTRQVAEGIVGRIVNLLDWRAFRPGTDHVPYTVSKAALAGMTKSFAAALAPAVSVNALALGAILPPSSRSPDPEILKDVPAGRWGNLSEVEETLIFLLTGPAYITGEIIHVDGGRHLA